ncbi:MAG: hypothetical protein RMI94_03860, partial [Bryobacterales bacterium]|nr:hypothetical protein [Bryobacteraceae bacterium]MDW8129659.1 hypothetical protein [Bryobacterales bacterium]
MTSELGALRAANLFLAAALFLSLGRAGVSRKWGFFRAYVAFHAARGAILLAVPIERTWYGH